MLISLSVSAQKEVTKFLGIPVDGTKKEMIRKLQAKGFVKEKGYDLLKGEFNGRNVYVSIGTNRNKVCRICVTDVNTTDETNIRIQFNNLFYQFKENSKYFSINDSDPIIPEDEDISYNISINNKRYQAGFCQLNQDDKEHPIDLKKQVWFMIDEKYGEYRILLFYDNEYNRTNGDDL